MRTYLRISLALLIALALSTSASAQTTAGTAHDRFSLNAAVGAFIRLARHDLRGDNRLGVQPD